jgi:hypothetical protein
VEHRAFRAAFSGYPKFGAKIGPVNWVSLHFWQLFDGVAGAALVALLVWWLTGKSDGNSSGGVSGSTVGGSAIASGSHNTQTVNAPTIHAQTVNFGHAPAPVREPIPTPNPSLRFFDLERRTIEELGNATGFLLPVRNDALGSHGFASDLVAHLSYQPLIKDLPRPREIHRGMWIGRDWYQVYLTPGETLHLVIAVADSNGCSVPNLPAVEPPESRNAATLRMLGHAQPQSIGTYQLTDGKWRVVVTIRGDGFRTNCTVFLTVEGQTVTEFRVVPGVIT